MEALNDRLEDLGISAVAAKPPHNSFQLATDSLLEQVSRSRVFFCPNRSASLAHNLRDRTTGRCATWQVGRLGCVAWAVARAPPRECVLESEFVARAFQ